MAFIGSDLIFRSYAIEVSKVDQNYYFSRLLAAKLYYFGVGGSVPTFLDFVKSRGKFDSIDRWTSKTEVPRKVIQLTRKSFS